MNAIDIFDDIKSVVESIETDNSATVGTNTRSITITGSDPIVHLQNRVNELAVEVTDMKRMVIDLMGKVAPLIAGVNAERERTRARVEENSFFKVTAPGTSVDQDMDARSITSISAPPSANSDMNENPFTILSRRPSPGGFAIADANTTPFRSSSATASMGYVRNKDVWGTALGSLLIGAARYYIARSGKDVVMIDERAVVKNCITIMPAIYNATMHKSLPGVRDPTTDHLSKIISRTRKDDIPVSDADTWVGALKSTDGKDIMGIMNNVIKYGSLVPEAFAHPISQLITNLVPPVARSVIPAGQKDAVSIFAMSSNTDMCMQPNPWEVWCSVLKEQALVKYVSYRLSGMKQPAVVAKMVGEMKESELTDKKNLETLRTVAPFTMRRSVA